MHVNIQVDILTITVTPEQVTEMAEHAHVYFTKDGRISMAGLNEHNLQVSFLGTDFVEANWHSP
jgi:aspartate aminotransferase